jgi:hypothetical protein
MRASALASRSKSGTGALAAIGLALMIGLATLLPGTAAASGGKRGTLISASKIARLTPAQAKRLIGQWEEEGHLRLDTRSIRSGIASYRLIFHTVGPDGTTPTRASGLVVVPRNGPRRRRRLVVWEHGTTVYKRDAPSTGADADARLIAYLFSGSGFLAVAPDYLGLGRGPGHHPYNDRAAEVSSSVDMIKAARHFLASHHIGWKKKAFVSGFSQGGKDAIAVGGALQAGAVPGLGLGAQAGVAGVYDIEHAQGPARAELDPIGTSFALAYTAVSWKHRYGLYQDPDEVFLDGLGPKIERLFDGHHDQGQIFATLVTLPPPKLFTPSFLELAAHPTGKFLEGIRNSDGACRYAPRTPTRLYAAHADDQVAFLNTRHCQRDFRHRGVKVPVFDVGDHGHFGSELISVPKILRWFQRLDRR